MYRDNVADLMLEPGEVDEALIAAAKALLVSGTALAKSPSREAVLLALGYARKHGTKVVFDIDYRPYTWASPRGNGDLLQPRGGEVRHHYRQPRGIRHCSSLRRTAPNERRGDGARNGSAATPSSSSSSTARTARSPTRRDGSVTSGARHSRRRSSRRSARAIPTRRASFTA